MTLTFRSPGKKFHHSIWCFLTRYVLVLFSLTFVLSGGLELVSSSSFFPWVSLQESYHHIARHSLRCCPVSNSVSLVSPPKLPDWDPLYCFDIPLLWHPIESLLSINFTTSNESFLFDVSDVIWFCEANFQLQVAIACETLIWSRQEVKTAGTKSFDWLF